MERSREAARSEMGRVEERRAESGSRWARGGATGVPGSAGTVAGVAITILPVYGFWMGCQGGVWVLV